MTLKEWFAESKDNIQAIYDSRNGQRYVYLNGQRLTKFAQNLHVNEVVILELEEGKKFGAWLGLD